MSQTAMADKPGAMRRYLREDTTIIPKHTGKVSIKNGIMERVTPNLVAVAFSALPTHVVPKVAS